MPRTRSQLIAAGKAADPLPGPDPLVFSPDLIDPRLIPEEVWPSLADNWSYCRTHYHTGNRLEDVYVFRLPSNDRIEVEVTHRTRLVLMRQTQAFRCQISFAFVLERIGSTPPELRVFYASKNFPLFEKMLWCQTVEGIEDIIEQIGLVDIHDSLKERRPNTKWSVKYIIGFTLYVYKFPDPLV